MRLVIKTKQFEKLFNENYDRSSWFDVLLLVCVFETFRKESINLFELNCAHYFSTPGYSWNPMLRFTDVTLELIADIGKYQFIEITIRTAISMICTMICKGYDETKKIKRC